MLFAIKKKKIAFSSVVILKTPNSNIKPPSCMNVHAEKRIINFYPFFQCEDARRRSGGFWMLSYIFENIKNHIIQHQFLLRFYCFSFQYSFYGFRLLFSQHWMPEKYLPLTSSELSSGKTSEWYCLVKRFVILKKKLEIRKISQMVGKNYEFFNDCMTLNKCSGITEKLKFRIKLVIFLLQ